MHLQIAFVIVAVVAGFGQARGAIPLQPDVITDPDAYAIYAVVVPRTWATTSKDTLLLQQETDTSFRCRSSVAERDPDWASVSNSFTRENNRARVLPPTLPIGVPYRLIPRSEIEADDARLEIKYPGQWQRRPEMMEYAAVSAVGFNAARTKAMVYVRLRSSGGIHVLEKRDGTWIHAESGGCGWIA